MTADTTGVLCLTCHIESPVKPDAFPQILPDGHGGGKECLECHEPMHPEMSGPPAIPHSVATRSDCMLCHDDQGVLPVPADHGAFEGDACFNCHQEGD